MLETTDEGAAMSAVLLILLILILAAVGGVIGTILEVAAWGLAILIVLGAILAFVIWRGIDAVRSRAAR